MYCSSEEYYEFHESREELKRDRDLQNLPEDCRECEYLKGNLKCGYGEQLGIDDCCWKDNPVKCKECAWCRQENANAELYCEYHGEFCEVDEKECEFFTEGDDLK